MAGELNFKAEFDYEDAERGVDKLIDIFEQGALKMNEAFSLGRTMNASKKQIKDLIAIVRASLIDLETAYKDSMDNIKAMGGLDVISDEEREQLENLKNGMDSARAMIRGLQENLNELNSNKNIFAGLTQGLQGLMGAYTAASGIMVQFGANEEDLVKIQTKLQASMSILMGMQQVFNALQSTSAFRIQVVTKATELYSAAQAALAKTSLLAKLGIAGLAAGIAIATIKIVSSLSKIAKAEKEANEQYQTISKKTADTAASQVTTFHKLQTEWKNANGNIDEQKRLVSENKDEWRKLGLEVNSINDYEKYAVEQAPAIVQAMAKKAEAAANLAVAEGLYAQAIQARMDAENGKKTKMKWWQTLAAGFAVSGNSTNGIETYNAIKNDFEQQNAQEFIDKAVELEKKAQDRVDKSIELAKEAETILPKAVVSGAAGADYTSKYAEIVAKQQRDIARQIKDLELETEQARIDAMDAGTAKTLAQIDLNFRKEEEAINRWYDDLIDEKIARDRELWEADPNNKGKAFTYNRADYTQSPEEQALYRARSLANDKGRLDGIQQVFDKYLTFAEKFQKSATGFQADIEALRAAGANIETLGEASKQASESFGQLAEQWIDDNYEQGLKEISEYIAELSTYLVMFGSQLSPDEIKLIESQIEALSKALKNNSTQANNSETNWTDLNKVLVDSASLFNEVGDAIGGPLGTALKVLGKLSSGIAQIRVGIQGIKKDGATFAEKFSAGVSIASAALSIISSIVSEIQASIERTNELNLATMKYEQTLQRIKDSKTLNAFVNAFGTNRYGTFLENVNIAEGARKNIADLIAGAAGSNPFSNFFMNIFDNPDLVSDMRTGWQKFWGESGNIFKAKWSDFMDEDGNLLGEKLQAWYETYGEGLTADNKKTVEAILAEWERWQDAIDEISGYLGDLFNNVSGALADKMLDNFIKTGSAIVDMTDYMNDFSKALAKSIVQGQLLDKVFDQTAQDEIGKLLAQGKIAEAVAYYNNLLGQANELAPAFNQWLEGINFNESTTQSATAGGFQTMSQDVANELNGRFAALQIAGENILLESRGIHADTSVMLNSVEEMRNLSLISMGHLEDIAKYTSVLPDMRERVINIEKYSKQMVS